MTTKRPDMRFVDYEHVAATYHDGRSGIARTDEWGRVVEPHLPPGTVRVLDLGAGTGIFARAWLRWGASCVIGLDPSRGMLSEARRIGLPAHVHVLVGRGEQIPLRAASVDVAWLSAVVHHIVDRSACANELQRVLSPRGRVMIRNFFAGTSRLGWLPYFPGAERAVSRFPSIQQIEAEFVAVGFRVASIEEVAEPAAPVTAVRAWLRKMRHSDSMLTAFTDEEFASGLVALDQTETEWLSGCLHLLVLNQ